MHTGLFFGSFNPIHQGHLILARTILNTTELKEIWFVVSPHNPLKEKSTLLNQYDRLHMVELALKGQEDIRSSSIEFGLPQPSYTIQTLSYLEEKHPKQKFALIMGEDNLAGLHKWRHYDQILERYPILVYPRRGGETEAFAGHPNVIRLDQAPVVEISSTMIRKFIKADQPIDFLVPDAVKACLLKEGYYRYA